MYLLNKAGDKWRLMQSLPVKYVPAVICGSDSRIAVFGDVFLGEFATEAEADNFIRGRRMEKRK